MIASDPLIIPTSRRWVRIVVVVLVLVALTSTAIVRFNTHARRVSSLQAQATESKRAASRTRMAFENLQQAYERFTAESQAVRHSFENADSGIGFIAVLAEKVRTAHDDIALDQAVDNPILVRSSKRYRIAAAAFHKVEDRSRDVMTATVGTFQTLASNPILMLGMSRTDGEQLGRRLATAFIDLRHAATAVDSAARDESIQAARRANHDTKAAASAQKVGLIASVLHP